MQIHHQSVFEKWPIEDKSVQVLITSPPYYSLRKYSIPDVIIGGDKDCKHEWGAEQIIEKQHHGKVLATLKDNAKISSSSSSCIHCNAWQGQHGLEPTFKLYLEHTKLWMQEAIRVLRDDGIIMINIADSYNGSGGQGNQHKQAKVFGNFHPHKDKDYPSKSKCLIPERFAIMAVDELGLILRNHIVWSKPNSMPESVIDRFSKKWESIFMFVKQPKYYFNLDDVREPHKDISIARLDRAISNKELARDEAEIDTQSTGGQVSGKLYKDRIGSMQSTEFQGGDYLVGKLNPLGKNPGDVWNIPTQPSPEKHFAMWPEKLVERMILCSTKAGDVVFDPFCGSGTTGRVAIQHNRNFIGIDLGYEDIQQRRTKNIQRELEVR